MLPKLVDCAADKSCTIDVLPKFADTAGSDHRAYTFDALPEFTVFAGSAAACPLATWPCAVRPAVQVGHGGKIHSSHKIRVFCLLDWLATGHRAGRHWSELDAQILAKSLAEARGGADCEVTACALHPWSSERPSGRFGVQIAKHGNNMQVSRLEQILDAGVQPDLAVIMVGGRDLEQGEQAQAIFEKICQIHSACHARGIRTVVLMPPALPLALSGLREVQRKCLLLKLVRWAAITPGVAAIANTTEWVPPVAYSPLWNADGRSLSLQGSKRVGQQLSSVLAPALGPVK